MFIAEIDPVAYAHPWDIPFDQRLAMMMAGTPRAAYFYSRPDTSTFRYRAYNVAQSLSVGRRGAAAWFTENDIDRIGRVLDNCDVLVLCRNSLYNERVARIASQARARGKPILFDVDDLVFDPSYIHLLMDTLDQDANDDPALNYWFSYVGRVSATLGLCDGVIATNTVLAERARAFTGKPAHVIRNALNREQQDISERIWDAKVRSDWAQDGRRHLGYFSGSPSHNRDFRLVSGPIAELMDTHPELHLRVVGYLDGVPDLARHRDRIELVPMTDFINLQREIGAVEINLVPLLDNAFTNCKSELKWFEAAIVGALTAASPIHSYRSVIEHGRTGWLSPAHQWHTTLTEIVAEVLENPRSHLRVLEETRIAALDRFGWDRQADHIADALFAGIR